MASSLTLKVGNVTATLNLSGSDQQVADVLRRFARSLGIRIDGTNIENLTAILEHIKDDVIRRSKALEESELRAANEAAIKAQVDIDNAI